MFGSFSRKQILLFLNMYYSDCCHLLNNIFLKELYAANFRERAGLNLTRLVQTGLGCWLVLTDNKL